MNTSTPLCTACVAWLLLSWCGWNTAIGPDGDPLRVDRRRVWLEVTELLLLLGIQPSLTTSLFWRLVKAAVLVGRNASFSQTGWHTEPLWNELDACT